MKVTPRERFWSVIFSCLKRKVEGVGHSTITKTRAKYSTRNLLNNDKFYLTIGIVSPGIVSETIFEHAKFFFDK